MKQFFSFIRKETYHIIRDKMTLTIMLVLPVIMLAILGFAVSTEIKNTSFVVLDKSKSAESLQFIEKINANAYFSLNGYLNTDDDIQKAFKRGDCKVAVIIPPQFANDLLHTGNTDIQVILDASDPNEASTLSNYFQMLLLQYQQEMAAANQIPQFINMEVKMLYNPQMISAYNFVPGLIGMIMMLICAMMTSISVVREKELGTMEILLVSPLKPSSIILAKAVPYLVVSILDVVTILLMAYFILGVPVAGNIFLVMLLSLVFTFSALALGLLISSITQTQQAAMMASAVGLMLPSMLLSGLIFPIESMPAILRALSYIVPARWFIEALRDVMIKGLGFSSIWIQFLVLLGMTATLLTISIKKFKNRL